MAKNNKKSLSLKEVFLPESKLDLLQGMDKDTPRNVYTPDTSENDNTIVVSPVDKLDGVNALGSEDLQKECACDDMPMSLSHGLGQLVPSDVIVLKIGHHADDMSKQGHKSIDIGRVGAPGGPDLSNGPGNDSETMIMHDYESDAVHEASMVGATGGPSQEGAVLLTDADDKDKEDEDEGEDIDIDYEYEFKPKQGYGEFEAFVQSALDSIKLDSIENDIQSNKYDSYASDWKPRPTKIKESFYDSKGNSSKIKDIVAHTYLILQAMDEGKLSLNQATKLVNSMLYDMYELGANESAESGSKPLTSSKPWFK
jgi:hypothetical protein